MTGADVHLNAVGDNDETEEGADTLGDSPAALPQSTPATLPPHIASQTELAICDLVRGARARYL